jgi:hypothetical protein
MKNKEEYTKIGIILPLENIHMPELQLPKDDRSIG